MKFRFLTPQQILIDAPLNKTFKAMATFGQGFKREGESYSEILNTDGNTYLVRYTTYLGNRTIVTKEEVTIYPPDLITYRHLDSPLEGVYEVFTAKSNKDNKTLVNYIGQYKLKKYDWPLIGWLIHKFIVLPQYDSIIAKHLTKVKAMSEKD